MSSIFSKFVKAFIPALLIVTTALPSASHSQDKGSSKDKHKVLFLGNSITLHGPSEKIEWTGNWGMAATALQNDYVHIVTKGIAEWNAEEPATLVRNIAEFERNYTTYDVPANLKDAQDFKADLVILCIGENIPALKTDEDKTALKSSIIKLVQFVKMDKNPRVMVRSPFWSDAAKEEVLKSVCSETGAIYVDISALGKDESNYGRSEKPWKNAGVGNHPGDKGIKAIGEAILKAIPD